VRNFLLLVVLLALVTSAKAQIDTETIPPAQDQRDLFSRAAASRLAVIGTVIKTEGRPKRIPPESLEESLKKGTALGGSLVTIQVEETVCRQSDFDKNAPRVDDRPQPFYIFVPFDESGLPDGDYREVLLPKHRYLLLLTELDTRSLSAAYELDPNRIYYRGQGHNRGVIPLDPDTAAGRAHNPPEVVDEFRKLCAAMRPPNPEDKLALLQQLAGSSDAVLAKEAENAKKEVKMGMAQEQQPVTKPR
jgi:hypothetical protein